MCRVDRFGDIAFGAFVEFFFVAGKCVFGVRGKRGDSGCDGLGRFRSGRIGDAFEPSKSRQRAFALFIGWLGLGRFWRAEDRGDAWGGF